MIDEGGDAGPVHGGPLGPVIDEGADIGRAYAGRRPAERRAERHRRLLDAGLEVFGSVGWEEATIGLLCATAQVGTRAFYEAFDSREQLLREVATAVVLDAVDTMRAALAAAPPTLEGRVEAGLAAYVGQLTADPRRVRVAYRAVPGAGRLLPDRHRASLAFAELIAQQVALTRPTETRPAASTSGATQPAAATSAATTSADRPGIAPALLALALTGAVAELLGWWAATTPAPPVEPVVAELSRLFVAALR